MIKYMIIGIILLFIVWFFYERTMPMQLEQVINVKFKDGPMPSYDIYYDRKQLIHPNTVSDFLKYKSDAMIIANMNLEFSKYDYIITYGKRVKKLSHSPYISFKDDAGSLGMIPVKVDFVNENKNDTLYIYKLSEKKKYRILF